MRISLLVVCSLLIGVALGVGSGLWGSDLLFASSAVTGDDLTPDDPDLPPLADETGPQPIVEVDEPVYNFGHMERLARGQHTFVVKNVGQAPLKLNKGPTTCKCTLSELGQVEIPPGESTEIKLEWDAKGGPEFRHGATIFTNDRNHRRLQLEIEGTLVDSLALNPPEIVFSNLTSDEEVVGRTRLATIRSDDLAVEDFSFDDPATAEFFAVRTEPLAADALPEGTKSGCEIIVTIKPGLPAGVIKQTIRVKTNVPDAAPLELKVAGKIGTPVLIVGQNWNQETGLLRLGVVPRSQGTKTELKMMIRGPHRHQIRLLPAKCDPDWIHVEFGESQDFGNVVAVPVTIEIPPHAPVVNHLGNGSDYATITIDSEPQEIGSIRLNVAFAVAD